MTAGVTPLRHGPPPPDPWGAEQQQRRQPPRNLEAEQAMLGAILMNNRAYERVADFLRPEHFADPLNGVLYEAMQTLIQSDRIVDPATLRPFCERHEGLAAVGGVAYLARLAGSAITIINAEDYGRTIYEAHLRRQMIAQGEELVDLAYGAEPGTQDDRGAPQEATALIEQAAEKLDALLTETRQGALVEPIVPMKAAVIQAAEAVEQVRKGARPRGLPTGLADLDFRFRSLLAGTMTVLGGAPKQGKSALSAGIARHVAETPDDRGHRRVAAIFSLEMSIEQQAQRHLAQLTGIPVPDQSDPRGIDDAGMARIAEAVATMEELPLDLVDEPGLTIAKLRRQCRRILRRRRRLDLVVVDYLQLMTPTSRRRDTNRTQEIGELARGLKLLAREIGAAMLVLSQLSRKVDEREDHRPQLSDLRESGEIEAHADNVLFIWRPEYYLEREKPTRRGGQTESRYMERVNEWEANCDKARNKAEIVIAAQRQGPTGLVEVHFDGPTTRFTGLARGSYEDLQWTRQRGEDR